MQLIIPRQWKQVKTNAKLCEQDYSKRSKWGFSKLGFICTHQLENDIFTLHQDRE